MARWVIQNIDREAVKTAKQLAIQHDLTIAEVVENALFQLWDLDGREDAHVWGRYPHATG